jgi:triosephosphate isomerase
MRKRIVAGNWKMNLAPKAAVELVEVLKPLVENDKVDVVYCVPFVDIVAVADAIKGTNIKLGAENLHFEDKGAFTGEVSAPMLKEIGVEYVVIGHSERREYFAETDDTVNKKVKKAIEYGIIPIVCVGESLEERQDNIQIEKIRIQVKRAFRDVSASDAAKTVIAYEPIWAIGTGKTATSEQAEEICKSIRTVVEQIYDKATADEVRIQYGGSVNAGNAAELFGMEDIDGGLVGGASLKADFANIVNA